MINLLLQPAPTPCYGIDLITTVMDVWLPQTTVGSRPLLKGYFALPSAPAVLSWVHPKKARDGKMLVDEINIFTFRFNFKNIHF